VPSLELHLDNGDAIQLRVEDVEAELDALKTRTGRFVDPWVDLTGPARGVVRTESIVAVVIR
jgi:hypothetical protein